MNQKSNAPLRLIFHIGAGKTGTSSIQHVLSTHQAELKSRGYCYLGLMLEFADSIIYPWQKKGASEEFFALDSETAQIQLTKVLQAVIDYARSNNLHTIIWSNEFFFRRSGKVIPVLKLLNIDISIVAYVRRHDAWAKSAYVQWGIRHKGYKGSILSFEKWIEKNKNILNFSGILSSWIEAFDDAVVIRNVDTLKNSVVDFLKYIELNPDNFVIERKNESPVAEELLLRALFNNKFDQRVLPSRFNQSIFGSDRWMDLTADDYMQSLMPSQERLNELNIAAKEDRSVLNKLLAKNGQDMIDAFPITAQPIKIDTEKLLFNLSRIVIDQAQKIQILQNSVDKLNQQKLPKNTHIPIDHHKTDSQRSNIQDPVFVISTGRSGSTLVQRVMNCHQDLVVWGEHFGFLRGLGDAYMHMSKPGSNLYPRIAAENQGPSILLPTLKNAAAPLEWVNPCSLEEFSIQIRNLIDEYFASKLSNGQRWGFKEILYNDTSVLRMLHEIYPLGKFVFIKRDILDVVRSKILAFIKIEKWVGFSHVQKVERIKILLNEVKRHYSVYETFINEYENFGILVNYEEIVDQPDVVTRKILEYLNLDPIRFDWNLSRKILGTVITETERNEELLCLINEINTSMDSRSDV